MIVHVVPSGGVVEELYTVPEHKECYVTGWACNTGTETLLLTVYAVCPAETPGNGHELYCRLPVIPGNTFTFTPIHLQAGEGLYVEISGTGMVCSLTGQLLEVV